MRSGRSIRDVRAQVERRAIARRRRHQQKQDLLRFDDLLAAGPPVLVFQMGKVGSSSVHDAVRARYPGLVVQNHDLSTTNPDPLIRRIAARRDRSLLPITVISLVRLPLDREISDMFENYEKYFGKPDDTPSVAQLRDTVMKRTRRYFPDNWYRGIFRPAVGVDVLSDQYEQPGEGTWQFRGDTADVLVMRAELSDDAKRDHLQRFLGVTDLDLRHRNVGTDKRYAATYERFRREARFPRAYVERMCRTPFFERFYDESFRKDALRRWAAD